MATSLAEDVVRVNNLIAGNIGGPLNQGLQRLRQEEVRQENIAREDALRQERFTREDNKGYFNSLRSLGYAVEDPQSALDYVQNNQGQFAQDFQQTNSRISQIWKTIEQTGYDPNKITQIENVAMHRVLSNPQWADKFSKFVEQGPDGLLTFKDEYQGGNEIYKIISDLTDDQGFEALATAREEAAASAGVNPADQVRLAGLVDQLKAETARGKALSSFNPNLRTQVLPFGQVNPNFAGGGLGVPAKSDVTRRGPEVPARPDATAVSGQKGGNMSGERTPPPGGLGTELEQRARNENFDVPWSLPVFMSLAKDYSDAQGQVMDDVLTSGSRGIQSFFSGQDASDNKGPFEAMGRWLAESGNEGLYEAIGRRGANKETTSRFESKIREIVDSDNLSPLERGRAVADQLLMARDVSPEVGNSLYNFISRIADGQMSSSLSPRNSDVNDLDDFRRGISEGADRRRNPENYRTSVNPNMVVPIEENLVETRTPSRAPWMAPLAPPPGPALYY